MTQAEFEKALTTALQDDGYQREHEDGVVRTISRNDVKEVLDTIGDSIYYALKTSMPTVKAMKEGAPSVGLTVRGLGRWSVRMRPPRKSRMGRNPATGEEIKIKAKPASRKLVVKPTTAIRDALKID